jgi:hypothetical protein
MEIASLIGISSLHQVKAASDIMTRVAFTLYIAICIFNDVLGMDSMVKEKLFPAQLFTVEQGNLFY